MIDDQTAAVADHFSGTISTGLFCAAGIESVFEASSEELALALFESRDVETYASGTDSSSIGVA